MSPQGYAIFLFACIAALGLTGIDLEGHSGRISRQGPRMLWRQKQTERSKTYEAQISALNSISSQLQASRDEQRCDSKKNNFREWIGVSGIYIAAIVAIWAISSSSDDARQQRDVMIGQLRTMEAEQRPWMAVEIAPGPMHVMPSDKNAPLLSFVPALKFTNVGKSPAFDAKFKISGYVVAEGHNDPYAEQKRFCNEFAHDVSNPWDRGSIVFPNQFFSNQDGAATIGVGIGGQSGSKYFSKKGNG